MAAEPFPLISVFGTPFERGKQYGVAAAARIRRSSALYSGDLRQLGLTTEETRRLIDGFLKEIAAFDRYHLEEMEGIATGAQVELAEIVMINARTEVVAKAMLDGRPGISIPPGEGCTGAVILPDRSADGRIIHGQNWDWREECVETSVVLRVEREDGPDFLTFVEAGGLARSGLNAAGISLTANYLETDMDHRQTGVPLVCIRRKILEQEHFAGAVRAIVATSKSCSNNMMIGSAEGFAMDFECTPDESFPLLPENGLITHANHFTSVAALSKFKDIGIAKFPDTYYREWRVRDRLSGRRRLTGVDLKDALADDFGTPFSVCRPPAPMPTGGTLVTVATVILDPSRGCMEIAPLPSEGAEFSSYSLRSERNAAYRKSH